MDVPRCVDRAVEGRSGSESSVASDWAVTILHTPVRTLVSRRFDLVSKGDLEAGPLTPNYSALPYYSALPWIELRADR
jgi:hypothetical protein